MSKKRSAHGVAGENEEGIELTVMNSGEYAPGMKARAAKVSDADRMTAAQTFLPNLTDPEMFCLWCTDRNDSGGSSSSNSNGIGQQRFYTTLNCKLKFVKERRTNHFIPGNVEMYWKKMGCPGCCNCELCHKRISESTVQQRTVSGFQRGGEVGHEREIITISFRLIMGPLKPFV